MAKYAAFISFISDSKFTALGGQPIDSTGMGRKVKLTQDLSLAEAIDRTKKHLGLPHLRLVLGVGHTLGELIHYRRFWFFQ